MLVKICDTVINLKYLQGIEIVGILHLSDAINNLHHLKEKMLEESSQICPTYELECTTTNDMHFVINTKTLKSTTTIYDLLPKLAKTSDEYLKEFIKRTTIQEPIEDERLTIPYDPEDVIYACILPVEDNFFVCVKKEKYYISSPHMSFKDCLKYLQNLSLISTYSKEELKTYHKEHKQRIRKRSY